MRMRVAILAFTILVTAGAFARRTKKSKPGEFDYAWRVGIADIRADASVCVALTDPKLNPGDSVSVIEPKTGTLEQMQLARKLEKSCLSPANTAPSDVSYQLTPAKVGSGELQAGVAVAIAGYTGPFTRQDGFIGFNNLRLEGPPDFVSSCTSQEGIHLFVWTGLPGKGKLQWHRYFYLGYDVEPSCTDAEVSAIGKSEAKH